MRHTVTRVTSAGSLTFRRRTFRSKSPTLRPQARRQPRCGVAISQQDEAGHPAEEETPVAQAGGQRTGSGSAEPTGFIDKIKARIHAERRKRAATKGPSGKGLLLRARRHADRAHRLLPRPRSRSCSAARTASRSPSRSSAPSPPPGRVENPRPSSTRTARSSPRCAASPTPRPRRQPTSPRRSPRRPTLTSTVSPTTR